MCPRGEIQYRPGGRLGGQRKIESPPDTERSPRLRTVLEVSRLRLNENFDRFNFEIYKEKEMADFRRWITVLAVMALFVGLAGAQVGGGTTVTGSPFTCAVQNVTVTPNLRSEGLHGADR